MDYEVFLVSRIREHWLASGDNARSVARGLAQTALVITCAALIMASVFFVFLLWIKVDIKMLALGLGASVLIDASVIRLMIVPSLMFLFDRYNWWAPAWLQGRLPGSVLNRRQGSLSSLGRAASPARRSWLPAVSLGSRSARARARAVRSTVGRSRALPDACWRTHRTA